MDVFADYICNLEEELPDGFPKDYLTDKDLRSELRENVRVALIDDGVNIMHKAIRDKIDHGKCCESGDAEPYIGGNFDWSATSHGTHMAYMIGRICPKVKIFVYKLDVARNAGDEKATFSAKSAADVCWNGQNIPNV